MRERTHAVGLSLFMLVAAVPAHADEGEPPAVAATRTSTASPWRRTVFLSTGLLLMDTAYTRPVEGVGGALEVEDRQIGGFGYEVGVAVGRRLTPYLELVGRLTLGQHRMSAN